MADLNKLLEKNGHTLNLVLGHGDSKDGTRSILDKVKGSGHFSMQLLDVSHGGRSYGSVVHPERFRQLAGIVNKLWEALPQDADVVGLVESDLVWEAEDLLKLIERADNYTLVAPLVLTGKDTFYDIWAFRANGTTFSPAPPYHRRVLKSGRYVEMDSVGSAVFTGGELGRRLSWPERDVVVGFCRLARKEKAQILVDTEAKVIHP